MDYSQRKAIEKRYEQEIKKICPEIDNRSGIYVYYRSENGFRYAYVGQAKHLLSRQIQHCMGYSQHIDMSLKKHKFFSSDNQTGWQLAVWTVSEENLNEQEQRFIKEYANSGCQMLNKTSGSQDGEKFGIAQNKPSRGYRDGLWQGRKNAINEIKHLFDLHLNATTKSGLKRQQTALTKFYNILAEVENENRETDN